MSEMVSLRYDKGTGSTIDVIFVRLLPTLITQCGCSDACSWLLIVYCGSCYAVAAREAMVSWEVGAA